MREFALDPVFRYAASFTLAAIFLLGALDKMRYRELFATVVEAYGLLPVPFVAAFAFVVMISELLIGGLLLFPITWPWSQLLGIWLLFVVTGAIVINIVRGRTDLACGCGGASADQELSWTLVLRNGVLAAVLTAAVASPTPRAMVALDYLSIALAVSVGFSLYATVNQLAANAPRLARLARLG
ncbi:MAG: MauE/DoxX family redox-associated membrane protein [Gammaproteobacteria bacterium]